MWLALAFLIVPELICIRDPVLICTKMKRVLAEPFPVPLNHGRKRHLRPACPSQHSLLLCRRQINKCRPGCEFGVLAHAIYLLTLDHLDLRSLPS